MPYPVIQHSMASPSTVGWVEHQKFVKKNKKKFTMTGFCIIADSVSYLKVRRIYRVR